MQQQLIDTYLGIMASLATLADDIAGYQSDVTDAKLKKGEVREGLPAWTGRSSPRRAATGLGSNEKDVNWRSTTCVRRIRRGLPLTPQLSTLTRTVAEMADEVSAAERRYGGLLHGQDPRGAAHLPGQRRRTGRRCCCRPQISSRCLMRGSPRNGNGAATVADAAELGL